MLAGNQLRKEGHDLILQPQAPFLDRHADSTGQDALRGGMHDPGTIRPVGPAPTFRHDAPGTMEHHSLDIETGGRRVIEKCFDERCVHARLARLCSREAV